jgi:hypothetical protein
MQVKWNQGLNLHAFAGAHDRSVVQIILLYNEVFSFDTVFLSLTMIYFRAGRALVVQPNMIQDPVDP